MADLDTLEGSGELRIREGQFQGSRFFREVARLVGTDLDRVAFSELGSDFRVSAGKIASDNVFLRETSEKLRNIGQDLGGAVKGFKEGVKGAEMEADAAKKAEASPQIPGATIDAEVRKDKV